MKPSGKLMALLAMGLLGSYPGAIQDTGKPITDFNEEDKRAFMEHLKEERNRQLLKKGIKEYTFDGIIILALNEKNAKRKYKNLLKSAQ